MDKVIPICKIQKIDKPIDKKQNRKNTKDKKIFNTKFQEIFDKCKLLEGDLK